MMALIQSQQALLDQFGYNGNVHATVASQNVNSTTMNLMELHTSMVQPILGVKNPPGFPQHYIGPHQLLVQTAQSAQPTQVLSQQSGSQQFTGQPTLLVRRPSKEPNSGN
nr:hypothetical protein [Tanacetum cinerariifolium]